MPNVPPLAERQAPGLSETLTGPVAADRCRSCGAAARPPANDADMMLAKFFGVGLSRWVECDPFDRPTEPPVILVLCAKCEKRLIEPHARLYIPVPADEPVPGMLPICAGCRFQSGVACTHPQAKRNGGPGVMLSVRVMRGIACVRGPRGHRGCRHITSYSPVSACRQKEA